MNSITLNNLKVFGIILSLLIVNNISGQDCATNERIATNALGFHASNTSKTGGSTTITTINQGGWVGSGSINTGTGSGSNTVFTTTPATSTTYFTQNNVTQAITYSTITNANLKGTGAITTVQLAFNDGLQVSTPNPITQWGAEATINIIYAGVTYARITTDNRPTYAVNQLPTATLQFLNGASGSYSATNPAPAFSGTTATVSPLSATAGVNGQLSITYPLSDNNSNRQNFNFPPAYIMTLNVQLPGTIPNTGTYQLQFISSASSSSNTTPSDDIIVYNANFKACPILFSGTVFNDANGMGNNTVDGTGFNPGGQVGLYDASGNLISGTATSINTDGTYSILYMPPANSNSFYTVRLISPTPAGYVNTGERISFETTSDGAANGITSPVIINTSVNVNTDYVNTNFGLNSPPVSNPVTANIPGAPKLTNLASFPMTGRLDSLPTSANTIWRDSVQITDLPTNGFLLKYDGIPVTVNQKIPNFDPAKLTIEPGPTTPNGSKSTTFNYSVIDYASLVSPKDPYTVNFSVGLPVVYTFIEAFTEGNNLTVNWQTASEKNNSHYIVEASYDGNEFYQLGRVEHKGSGTSDVHLNYSFTISINDKGSLAGVSVFGVLGILLLFSRKRNKWIMLGCVSLILTASSLVSCNKTSDNIDSGGKKMFIRLMQVDIDGTKSYSNTVKVINKN